MSLYKEVNQINESNNQNLSKRYIGIDYTKFIACLSVISIHFRLNFQNIIPSNLLSPKLSISMTLIYHLFVICVPLFLMSSGFLIWSKNYGKSYYMNVIKIYLLYVVCSILTILVMHYMLGTPQTLKQSISNILQFKAIPYSWFVEMYLGLALLFPSLNQFVQKTDKKNLRLLIVILMIISAIPLAINSNPLTAKFHLPAYWTNLYPLNYYLIGAYLSKYTNIVTYGRKNRRTLVFSFLFSIFIGSIINLYLNSANTGAAEGGYGSIIVMIQSVSIFILINAYFKMENKIVSIVSKITLPIYLMSYLADSLVYPTFLKFVKQPKYLLPLFPIIIFCVFTLSIIFATTADKLNNLIWKNVSKLFKSKSIVKNFSLNKKTNFD